MGELNRPLGDFSFLLQIARPSQILEQITECHRGPCCVTHSFGYFNSFAGLPHLFRVPVTEERARTASSCCSCASREKVGAQRRVFAPQGPERFVDEPKTLSG